MADKIFPQSGVPVRKTSELLPTIFRTDANEKLLASTLDAFTQPGVLQKTFGYIGKRFGKTYNGNDVYLDSDESLRSRYQLEPGVTITNDRGSIEKFYDFVDLKNQLSFFGNKEENDSKVFYQDHYSWDPPIDWDKFVNYREYYWEPLGPPPVQVAGQSQTVVSRYRVTAGTGSTWIFSPDGLTNNPTLILYRGQTYYFDVVAPGQQFTIRSAYDKASLLYDPNAPYNQGQLVVFDDKLWRARNNIAAGDGSTIDENTQDWEYVENVNSNLSVFNYNKGITNNGATVGVVEFKIPLDAPDVLFYQSVSDPDRLGRFIIADVGSNTKIDVEKEILGKSNYTSSNGIELTNGLIIEFSGQVFPEKYSKGSWVVDGVGKRITLTRFDTLVAPNIGKTKPEVLFDNAGFDIDPFDDAAIFPGDKDYILIARDSQDLNPWSRYNRWFHRSVLEFAYRYRGIDFPSREESRAKRPIIEFKSNLKLFNHGSLAKETVDYIDDFTIDVFSTIEGSQGFSVDGEELFDGARLLITADSDNLANNKIYVVRFISHNGRRQITLQSTADSESNNGECLLIRRGKVNAGVMYHFENGAWLRSQSKTSVNQNPLFDAFDENGNSFSDQEIYPVSDFRGTKILCYKEGTGNIDAELGLSTAYLNIENVGDILFDWTWESDNFSYTINFEEFIKKISTGYFLFSDDNKYANGWLLHDNEFDQPIIDSVIVENDTDIVELNSVDWKKINDQQIILILYINGERYNGSYTRTNSRFIFPSPLKKNDILSLKLYGNYLPERGYYQLPVGLEKNPLNDELLEFTYGQAIDHLATSLETDSRLQGNLLGSNNIRDLNDYISRGQRFLKHSGISPLGQFLICDKEYNIIKSLQLAKKTYNEFKNNFIKKAVEVPFDDSVANMVDSIIDELSKSKNSTSPYFDSDLLGSGAFTSLTYEVEDTGIKTYLLSEKFSLDELSRRAVYVYVNSIQLYHGEDYTFDKTFGFVNLNVDLSLNDIVEIREYINTSGSFIPPTPTSLGIYKKFRPERYIDDTYQDETIVIQGHDGSITLSYGDFRDDLILELEKRIYNNIKKEYDPKSFDFDLEFAGYYGNGTYDKSQLDNILSQEFIRYIFDLSIDYTNNLYFDSENAFTYTYSNMTDPTGNKNLPGWWRGVYQWFYDTDRPHSRPWEMLGFTIKPMWWNDVYGPAPYTSNNLLLWEDIRDGVIRQGDRQGRYQRYARTTILQHLPVDEDGNLVDPLNSGLARDFVLINNKGPFVFGDVSPIEYVWRKSSDYSFSMVIAACLLNPFKFLIENFDRSNSARNKLDQVIDNRTGSFKKLANINFSLQETDQPSIGLINYLTSYCKSKNYDLENLQYQISNININLTTRLSGFVDKQQQKYILDSKNPRSTSNSIFIPDENYDIIFNVSTPIYDVAYSAVILEKTDRGFKVSGYDILNPKFLYFKPYENQSDPFISVGGVSEKFTDWSANTNYFNGQLVRRNSNFYRSIKTHNSGNEFEVSNYQILPTLPLVGAVEAKRRRTFNQSNVLEIPYGTIFETVQQVVDFLLGYESYLESRGFVFDDYNSNLSTSINWTLSCKEFMYWTRHSWSIGSLISLSPAARRIVINNSVGVIENLIDGFYDYQVFRSDGVPIPINNVDVKRDFQTTTVSIDNIDDGIYFIRMYFVLKEHVTIFNDRTVFNDVLYDKSTGYRQERIKSQGFRTTDWDGDYTSPGFLYDSAKIEPWEPFKDYKLGDIISYQSVNYTSIDNQVGVEFFNSDNWAVLDVEPREGLLPNFDYRINLFEDYFEINADGIGTSQRNLARHSIAYQPRNYLNSLSEDSVTQFQLYQGFIREKGTFSSVYKIFDKLGNASNQSITINEEWAIRAGTFGGVDQIDQYEIEIKRSNFELNPQVILLEPVIPANKQDNYYRLVESDFTIKKQDFSFDLNPKKIYSDPLLTAGYVRKDQINITVKDRQELLTLDINSINENDHIWITFDEKRQWEVLRFGSDVFLVIESIENLSLTEMRINLSRPHNLSVGDIIGIKAISNLEGFFSISAVSLRSIIVDPRIDLSEFTVDGNFVDFDLVDSSRINLYTLTSARYKNFEQIDDQYAALLPRHSYIFIDNDGSNRWAVQQKQKQYSPTALFEVGVLTPKFLGSKVIYDTVHNHVIAAIPSNDTASDSGYVVIYTKTARGLVPRQIIAPPNGFEIGVKGSFGLQMALSPDAKYLILASPLASGIRSNYRGDYNVSIYYAPGDIVLYAGRLWECVNDQDPTVLGDGSTIDLKSQDWKPARKISGISSGRSSGYTEQGVITIYEYQTNQWVETESIISPRPQIYENFGSSISISQTANSYYLAVSAKNSNNKGRVYLYKYNRQFSQRIVQTFPGVAINYATNAITIVSHGFQNGQRVFYYNGTLDGQNTTDIEQITAPNPPLDDTIFYVIRINNNRFQLAASVDDFLTQTAADLNDIGINDSSFHTLISPAEESSWELLENNNYVGIYNPSPSRFYPENSIVFFDGNFFQSLTDQYGDGSTLTTDSTDWIKIDPISTNSSLPQMISVDDDGSTLGSGLLTEQQQAELIKGGDQYGFSLAMNRDGSILVVSAPESDGQYFINYKGIWKNTEEYKENDVVKHENKYYKLADNKIVVAGNFQFNYRYTIISVGTTNWNQIGLEGPPLVGATFIATGPGSGTGIANEETDSTIRSYNEIPENGLPWIALGDSTTQASGKIFVYKRNNADFYDLVQTINNGSLLDFGEIDSTEIISAGDQFGFSLDLDLSGRNLVVSSPKADINFQDQGSVYIFKTQSLATPQFRLEQKLQSFENYTSEYFGYDVKITDNSEKIVVGARNTAYFAPVFFDSILNTSFDGGATSFYDDRGFAGAVYVFDKKGDRYLLTEKLEADLSNLESFGYSIDCTDSIIAVGSPDFVTSGSTTGNIRLFEKDPTVSSWNLVSNEQPLTDLSRIKSISFFDQTTNTKINEIDIVDISKLKILGLADQEIKFKTLYDPAVYSIGTENQIVDPTTNWKDKHLGELWWDLSSVKSIYYEQSDLNYRSGNWNELAYGSSIDIYEWVESNLLPSEWAAIADTTDGLSQGISGIPLYPDDSVYSIKSLFNETTQEPTETLYYYWVRNKTILPREIDNRRIPAAEVANYISNPFGSGLPFVGLIDSNKFLAYNLRSMFKGDRAYLNLLYYSENYSANPVHQEYLLLSLNNADSLPNADIERKWIDSLIGFDTEGNRVPDENLSEKQKYGISFRPRQSLFVDRLAALEITILRINQILLEQPYSDIIDFRLLNSVDPIPDVNFNLYDVEVDTLIDLQNVGTVKLQQAVLRANLINGEIDSIDVISTGFGYRVPPPVVIQGDGFGAEAEISLDNQGRISTVTITSKGRNYSNVSVNIREFAVLVKNDSSARNFWSIYSWDSIRKIFFRTKTQSYDVSRFWNRIDWWKSGYSGLSRISKEISSVFEEPTIETSIGELLRIKEYGTGGWAVFEKINNDNDLFLDNWSLVGRQNGTIKFSDVLYSKELTGFDNVRSYDINVYDLTRAAELRIIFQTVKEDIFVNDLAVEWNRLFFSSLRYVFSEQFYVDWAFKTSFIKAEHDAGELIQKINYRSDNLSSYQEYLNEVKPYRSTIREFISSYNKLEISSMSAIDFDLPPHYSSTEGKIVSTSISDEITDSYPWKWYKDNTGFSITDILVSNAGSLYTSPPGVIIEGDGSGASATAFISNGRVTAIRVDNQGSGYTTTPIILLAGGNSTGGIQAKAVAIIGNSLFRSFNLSIKFDRISKLGFYSSFTQVQNFVATGSTATFNLNYAPTRDKTKIRILKNNQIVLGNEYIITLFTSNVNSFSLLQGRITFNQIPQRGDIIEVQYEKNEELFDAVNRIDKLYNPRSGMRGKEKSQLMTGIDFGGVQVQGTTFDVTGGWDALPWFTDGWDSVQQSSDYYYVAEDSTTAVILPYTPSFGQIINIYLKRAGNKNVQTADTILTDELTGRVYYETESSEPITVRIDDPNFDENWDSSVATNPNAQMPTFIGDGSTRSIEIGRYIQTFPGDILIFRPEDSDGSVSISDPNIIDTQLSGGTLASLGSAYITATGKTAEEIVIDGANFISPTQVPAPEENVPGQVLDSVSIKVFQNKYDGVSPLISKTIISDGITSLFEIGQEILTSSNVLIFVNKILLNENDYNIDFLNNSISLINVPVQGEIIEIISLGIGGLSILGFEIFSGDGETTAFISVTNYTRLANIFVTVDGVVSDAQFVASEDISDIQGKTGIIFALPPSRLSVIKVLTLGASADVDSTGYSVVNINQETLIFDGSTRKFNLINFVDLARGTSRSSVIVEANGIILQGVDTNYYIFDGTKFVVNLEITEPNPLNPTQTILVDTRQVVRFPIANDPVEDPGVVLSSNVFVYLNDQLTTNYSYDSIGKFVEFQFDFLQIGDVIKIENDIRAEYNIVDNDLQISPTVLLNEGDQIKIIWFGEYPSMAILSDEFTGGKLNYQLAFTPVSSSFVWIYKNGIRLIQDVDYYLSKERAVIYLKNDTLPSDLIKVVLFGTNTYVSPSAFEIYKDILNRVHYKRYSKEKILLTQPLNYYDNEIKISDASSLISPDVSRNIPGIIVIGNERISYFEKDGNTLKKLRRGTFGSATAEIYPVGTEIINSGIDENLPYSETQLRNDFISDGSTLNIGPLSYVPQKTFTENWYRNTIPVEYGPCNEIEVFVAGRRLRKSPVSSYNESKGSYSPLADETLEAEFSVDGQSNTIRLTERIPVGQRITVIKKTGSLWYERGETTASLGKSLLENNTAVARFIAKKNTLLPE